VLERDDDAPMLVESITQIGAEVIELAASQSGGVEGMIDERSVVNEAAEKHLREGPIEIHGPEAVRVSVARPAFQIVHAADTDPWNEHVLPSGKSDEFGEYERAGDIARPLFGPKGRNNNPAANLEFRRIVKREGLRGRGRGSGRWKIGRVSQSRHAQRQRQEQSKSRHGPNLPNPRQWNAGAANETGVVLIVNLRRRSKNAAALYQSAL